jgi:hypothetical protein
MKHRTPDPYRETDVIDANAPRFNQAVIGVVPIAVAVGRGGTVTARLAG